MPDASDRSADTAWLRAQDQPGDLHLLFAGDTNVQQRDDPAEAFRHVRPLLAAADIRLAHLEGMFAPTRQPAAPDIPHKPQWRHSEPAAVEAFRDAGFHALCCASNVSYGREPVVSAVDRLDAAGIAHAGIGRNLAEAQRPAIVTVAGIRVGLLSRTSVFWPYDHEATATLAGAATLPACTAYEPGRRALEMPGAPPEVRTWPDPAALAAYADAVREVRGRVDVLVASFHWGVSSSTQVMEYQRTVAHAAVDAGVDLVVGHHPHVLQPVEVYRGRPIFYSLGNFAFDWPKMRGRARQGAVAHLVLRGGKPLRAAAIPAHRYDPDNLVRIHPTTDAEGGAIAEALHSLTPSQWATLTTTAHEVVIAL